MKTFGRSIKLKQVNRSMEYELSLRIRDHPQETIRSALARFWPVKRMLSNSPWGLGLLR